jgi:hypothetical protein
LLLKNLTPASRRQDHTTSPSAVALFVKSAAASIASNPASVTIAIRPLSGVDGENDETDLPETKREKFLKKGLDTRLAKQPVGQISRPHRFRGEQMRCSRTAICIRIFTGCGIRRLVSEAEMRYAGGLFAWK